MERSIINVNAGTDRAPAYRIKEVVNAAGNWIFWPELYRTKFAARCAVNQAEEYDDRIYAAKGYSETPDEYTGEEK